MGDKIDTIKKNTQTLMGASKEVGLEVNSEKTKCMLLSCQQNVWQNYDIKIANRCFENVAQCRYLGMTVTNKNLIQEEIKRRLILVMLATIQSRTFCLFVCCLNNVKIRIFKTIILPVVLYGVKVGL
jgi:ribosomal protein S2